PAPASTSLSQCLRFIPRITPVVAATPYPAIPIHGDTSLYSLNRICAPRNAVAVCSAGTFA
ncbi:MAG: hypothetical protein LBK58_01845, partial [Prevotellaceae bacterium]|nr:hypothetical protein [Prevotellaceae bacterium]